MSDRLVGVETEYALGVPGQGARSGLAPYALLQSARSQLPYLPDEGSGIFLQNGARFYVDCGGHPEMTTPECADPWDVVRYVKAGEAILLRLAGGRTAFFRCNVDYSGSRSTWGSHESYLHRADPRLLPKQLVPHLVSRLVYAGAGGFSNLSPGLEFTLSPRTPHISREVSHDSTTQRGIFHTKDESLSGDGYHRLHVLCGETLCSELATWLKVGTTALVVAMSEAGLGPGEAVVLRSPVGAMQLFANDPTCTAAADTVHRGRLTAIDIQRHYLEAAERHLDHARMPPWAGEVCRRWRAVLDALVGGWQAVSTTLDWAIKLALYREQVRRRGLEWESLRAWSEVANRLTAALARLQRPERALTLELVLGRDSPLADEVARLTRTLMRERGLRWSALGLFLAMRDELFEIDMRFGQLGKPGIFTALDDAGVLAHRVEGVDDIEGAITNPPAVGRARLRGELVRELSGRGDRYLCGWQGVWDSKEARRADLSDPLATVVEWKRCGEGAAVAARGLLASLGLEPALMARRRGERVARRRGDPPA